MTGVTVAACPGRCARAPYGRPRRILGQAPGAAERAQELRRGRGVQRVPALLHHCDQAALAARGVQRARQLRKPAARRAAL